MRFSGIAVFLLVMLANGVFALRAVSTRYTQSLEQDAERTGAMLTDTLNRLLLVGISFDRMDSTDSYLTSIADVHEDGIALEILNPQGRRMAGSTSADTGAAAAGSGFSSVRGRGDFAAQAGRR